MQNDIRDQSHRLEKRLKSQGVRSVEYSCWKDGLDFGSSPKLLPVVGGMSGHIVMVRDPVRFFHFFVHAHWMVSLKIPHFDLKSRIHFPVRVTPFFHTSTTFLAWCCAPHPDWLFLTRNIPSGVLWGPHLVCYWLISVEINKHKIFDTNNAWITEL